MQLTYSVIFVLICVNTFKSYELLKQHIDCAHKKKKDESGLTNITDPVLSQCPALKCLGKQFQNLRDLMFHQRNSMLRIMKCCTVYFKIVLPSTIMLAH